uniref:Uncharacterized protein n=1 Tax=Pinguiococcus pyrenoidosus TaxID=172671 RepID=A0A7R9YBV0_9STRA|mmetsp:Transcript_17204/g.65667  ORF Transcript_17204/g.65667 Transcript_17204/m.65667 type:complete len:302 (+) Transcript_17204:127-1032(+)|eukprot:scaffold1154_cov310-Pinguiococcus_pyrenoidosus.AAC.7
MFKTIAPVALLLAFSGRAAAVQCAGISFFGEDRNPDDGQNDVLPLEAFPNADAARDSFFAALTDVSTEDFEGDNVAVGDTEPVLEFPGGVSAVLTGGEIREDPPVNGQFAISAPTYFSTDQDFEIDFTEPVFALGFYGVDIGDVQGQLSFLAVQLDNSTCELEIPHEIDGPSGGVLYFGYIDLAMPFTRVMFRNSEGDRDRFGFDNFTISLRDGIVLTDVPSAAPTPFELCAEGITNADESICCDAGCGVCGGCDCALNPGGEALCCPGFIFATGIECVISSDVACILDEYIPSEESECLV